MVIGCGPLVMVTGVAISVYIFLPGDEWEQDYIIQLEIMYGQILQE